MFQSLERLPNSSVQYTFANGGEFALAADSSYGILLLAITAQVMCRLHDASHNKKRTKLPLMLSYQIASRVIAYLLVIFDGIERCAWNQRLLLVASNRKEVQMSDRLRSSVKDSPHAAKPSKHPAILRVSSFIVAGALSVLMVTTVIPPIVADQSDRAVVNAPVTLLTAPIDGEVESLSAKSGSDVRSGTTLARISNTRLDRATLISLEEKTVDAREKLEATKAKKEADHSYLRVLNQEITDQSDQLKARFKSQTVELRARVEESRSQSREKMALVDRQNGMVNRNTASVEMVKPTAQQYSAAVHKSEAESAKLVQKISQLDALEKGIYVGDDLLAIGSLTQKHRDVDLDAKRLEIEERELSAVLKDRQRLIDTERARLDRLADADVRVSVDGKVLSVGAAVGRRVSAGDTIASIVDCNKRFVVAIFSYRQGQSMAAGTRVHVEGASFKSGVVTAVLPKTSDKVDEGFAIPFPQTERRELFAIITPHGQEVAQPEDAAFVSAVPCAVGQWVTVTRENGVIPSMSVAWRHLTTLVSSWSPKSPREALAPGLDDDAIRQEGVSRLATAFRSSDRSASDDAWAYEGAPYRWNPIASR